MQSFQGPVLCQALCPGCHMPWSWLSGAGALPPPFNTLEHRHFISAVGPGAGLCPAPHHLTSNPAASRGNVIIPVHTQ